MFKPSPAQSRHRATGPGQMERGHFFRLMARDGPECPRAPSKGSLANPYYFFTNKASEAVYPWRKFFWPTGPISPLQKKPATPRGPSRRWTISAS